MVVNDYLLSSAARARSSSRDCTSHISQREISEKSARGIPEAAQDCWRYLDSGHADHAHDVPDIPGSSSSHHRSEGPLHREDHLISS
jgi:hypothetical protein